MHKSELQFRALDDDRLVFLASMTFEPVLLRDGNQSSHIESSYIQPNAE